jgi:glutamate-1-semialdehyde 2,1-aminomutase
MAAGLAQLHEMEKQRGWQRLEEIGAIFESGVRKAMAEAGCDYTFHRVGSMFCLFFTGEEVFDLDGAKAAAAGGSFKPFFHACLEKGVFLAPSPYETGFLCMAHAEEDIARTVEVIGEAFTEDGR